jgi:hypothetical protein
LFLARFRKWPFPFGERGTLVLDFIPTRLSVPFEDRVRLSGSEPGDLALGDVGNLAALQADIKQLPVGELFELVDRGEAVQPVAEARKGAADQGAAKDPVGPVKGQSG